MNQKEQIVSLLKLKGILTQGELALEIYGDKWHSPNIYSSLQTLLQKGIICYKGSRPKYYSLSNVNFEVPEKQSMKKSLCSETIIIERMFAGGYLNDNIGHEIVNTVKTDSGENYIYISPWGVINEKYQLTKYVLLVRLINQHCFEVLSYAGDLELLLSNESLKTNRQKRIGRIDSDLQSQIITDFKVNYGGVPINYILSEQENTVFLTFRANKYRRVKPFKKVYIVDDQKEIKDENYFYIEGMNFSKQSLKMYASKSEKEDAYACLESLIENEELWELNNTSKSVSLEKERSVLRSFLDVIGKGDDELAYSNWISFYLANDTKMLVNFGKEVLGLNIDQMSARLEREKSNIDIFIEDIENVIVIENKVKSGINGIDFDRHDLFSGNIRSQLSKYVDIGEKEANKDNLKRKSFFFIFLPNYSYKDDDLSIYAQYERYRIIRYSALFDFFEQQKTSLPYFVDFLVALKKQTSQYRTDLYEIMEDRFVETIKNKISNK